VPQSGSSRSRSASERCPKNCRGPLQFVWISAGHQAEWATMTGLDLYFQSRARGRSIFASPAPRPTPIFSSGRNANGPDLVATPFPLSAAQETDPEDAEVVSLHSKDCLAPALMKR